MAQIYCNSCNKTFSKWPERGCCGVLKVGLPTVGEDMYICTNNHVSSEKVCKECKEQGITMESTKQLHIVSKVESVFKCTKCGQTVSIINGISCSGCGWNQAELCAKRLPMPSEYSTL